MVLTLLSRAYCHLCHDMQAGLEPLARAFGAEVEIVDVDADPVLEKRYGEFVPVLLHGECELCHYFLDEPAVRAYLENI